MYSVGLTSGIGCGKTLISKVFNTFGVPIFNSDQQAKELYKEKEFLTQIVHIFGSSIIEKGEFCPQKLANIIFNDNKEGYGKTLVIQRSDGIEVWYGNLKNTSVSIYDYVKKGDLLGEASGEEIYIVFVKEGKNLDYKKYL